MKLINVLKATMKGDMSIFKYKGDVNVNSLGKKVRNLMLVIFLTLTLVSTVATYAFMIASPLHEIGLTYVVLTLFIVVTSLMLLLEGIYKSQGILFDARDNDLLFSMPVKKSTILTARLIKLMSFEYIITAIILLPTYGVYIFLENPSISFYIMSLIMFVLVPIIPTIISCIIGYVIKATSSVFKNKKLIQIVFSLVITIFIFLLSFKMQDFVKTIAEKATSINDAITKIYYPVGLYVDNLNTLNIVNILKLFAVNIIPVIIYVWLFSILYFKIISKSSEFASKSNYRIKTGEYKRKSQLDALFSKEMNRFLSSPIYMLNTCFGLVILIIAAISASINLEGTIGTFLQGENIETSATMIEQIKGFFPKAYMALMLFVISMLTITASSISLEGSSFDLTKTLPVSTKKIFLSKILVSDIVSMPILILTTIFVIIRLQFSMIDSIVSIAITLILPNLIAILGLIINLKFPLFNAKSDTVVVKQSASVGIAIFAGIAISALPLLIYLIFYLLKSKIDIDQVALYSVTGYLLLTLILWAILLKYGNKRFKEICN